MATAFAALAALLAYFGQRSADLREKRRIVVDVYERFFSHDQCQVILRLIERIPKSRFWIVSNELDEATGRTSDGRPSEYDLDDFLGYFELLGQLVHDHAVLLRDVDNLFGWYIERAWKHPAVQEYVASLRAEDSAVYVWFEYLSGLVLMKSSMQGQAISRWPVAWGAGLVVVGMGLAGWSITALYEHPSAFDGAALGAGAGMAVVGVLVLVGLIRGLGLEFVVAAAEATRGASLDEP